MRPKARPQGELRSRARQFFSPETLGNQLLTGSPCSAGHRQKLEDQTKAYPDRFGDLERLRMRVTPSTPSPRGSLGTASHFSSQAQTPIQGTAQRALRRGEADGILDAVLRRVSITAPPLCCKGGRHAHSLRQCFPRDAECPSLGSALHSFIHLFIHSAPTVCQT